MKWFQLLFSAVAATVVLAESDWKAERRQYCPKCRPPNPPLVAAKAMETVVIKREPEPKAEPEPVKPVELAGMNNDDIVDWKTERRQYCPKCPSVPPPSSKVSEEKAKREAEMETALESKAERRQYCPKCPAPQPSGATESAKVAAAN